MENREKILEKKFTNEKFYPDFFQNKARNKKKKKSVLFIKTSKKVSNY